MKTEAIVKINKMGKAGRIITLIGKILCGMGLAVTLLGTLFMACMPKDFIQFQVGTQGVAEINLAAIGQHISEEAAEVINSGNIAEDVEIAENITLDGSLTVNTNGGKLTLDQFSVENDVLTISTNGETVQKMSLHELVYVLLCVLLSLAMTMVTLFFAGFLCAAIERCDSPFDENVIVKMRNFAFSLLPWVILSSATNSLISSLMAGNFDMNVSIDVSMLIIVLVILALTYIFKYGAVLQQESDETL